MKPLSEGCAVLMAWCSGNKTCSGIFDLLHWLNNTIIGTNEKDLALSTKPFRRGDKTRSCAQPACDAYLNIQGQRGPVVLATGLATFRRNSPLSLGIG